LKSTSAAYLAGLLLGQKAKQIKEKVILDTGLIPSTKGSKVYAAVKGFADSGMEIKYDEKIMPSKERIEGKHMKVDFSETFNKIVGVIENKKPITHKESSEHKETLSSKKLNITEENTK